MYVKIPNKITPSKQKARRLVNVCAWCPKEEYPKLEEDEEYTHGLCEKHYYMLRVKRKETNR